ncbi:MAG: hypothetical protein RQ733_01235 [Methyloprofundus sp.]|nr:hypothetical protein [Methyloprofundus sp.]
MKILQLITLSFSLLSSPAWALLPFEHTGKLYVSIWSEDIVKVFSTDGKLLDAFTAPGLGGPRAIVEFDLNGNILTVIDQAKLRDVTGDETLTIVPQGIAFDDQGHFTVASFDNQIFRFDNAGQLIWFEDDNGIERYSYKASVGNSRSIAFEPLQPIRSAQR